MDGARPSSTGAYGIDDTHPYLIDRGLVRGLVNFFGTDSVTEFGAGKGCYTDALRIAGVPARGFEGAEGIQHLTHGFIQHADLTTELELGLRDWVLCLEVAEHVPKQHELTMLNNVHRHGRKGVVLSWSSAKAGIGHVNPQPASYVHNAMRRMNYTEDVAAGKALRKSVSTWSWLVSTANHGKAGGGVRVWRKQSN